MIPPRHAKALTRLGPRILVLAWLATACSDAGTSPDLAADTTAVATPENPLDGFVAVASNVQIHYLDFGGTGEPLLLLAGLGNTANVFRTFAPLLTDHFRVRALTRRGYGRSSQPADGYDRATLARDIRILLDGLGITTVNLVGHSIAGAAMSRFAVAYPARLGKLVYLDAAYDRTGTAATVPPAWSVPPPPTAADGASREAYGAYLTRTLGFSPPPEEIAAQTVVGSNGAIIGWVTPGWVADSILDNVESPDYAGITAPALGIYAVAQTPADFAPWLVPNSSDWTDAETYLATVLGPAQAAQRDRFDSEVPNSTLLELEPASHYLFLCCAEAVAAAVIAFLENPYAG